MLLDYTIPLVTAVFLWCLTFQAPTNICGGGLTLLMLQLQKLLQLCSLLVVNLLSNIWKLVMLVTIPLASSLLLNPIAGTRWQLLKCQVGVCLLWHSLSRFYCYRLFFKRKCTLPTISIWCFHRTFPEPVYKRYRPLPSYRRLPYVTYVLR